MIKLPNLKGITAKSTQKIVSGANENRWRWNNEKDTDLKILWLPTFTHDGDDLSDTWA